MKLYKWQEEAIKLFLKKRKLISEVATGAGKSRFAIECIKELWKINPNYNILIVAPKIVILKDTWIKELFKYDITFNKIGVYYGFAKEYSKITITTTASVKKIPLEIFDVLISDEVHNMSTPRLMSVINYDFKYKLGLSASLYDGNQKHWKLIKAFDYNLYKYTTKQAIEDKIINDFIFFNISVNIKEPEVKEKYDEIQYKISKALEAIGGFYRYNMLPESNPDKLYLYKLFNDRNELVMNYYRKIDITCKIIGENKNKKIIVFNQYNKISGKIFWGLTEYGVKARIMNSDVNEKIWTNQLRDYKDGKFNVLLTTRMTDEGYNLPSIDLAIIFSGNSTGRQIIQRIGRVLRKKEYPSIIYQVYVKNTFEEEFALKRFKLLKELALNTINMEY